MGSHGGIIVKIVCDNARLPAFKPVQAALMRHIAVRISYSIRPVSAAGF